MSHSGLATVADPHREAHPSTDAKDPKHRSKGTGLGKSPGAVTSDCRDQSRKTAEKAAEAGKANFEQVVVTGAGEAVEVLGGDPDGHHEREDQTGPGDLVASDLEDDQCDEEGIEEVIGKCHALIVWDKGLPGISPRVEPRVGSLSTLHPCDPCPRR